MFNENIIYYEKQELQQSVIFIKNFVKRYNLYKQLYNYIEKFEKNVDILFIFIFVICRFFESIYNHNKNYTINDIQNIACSL